MDLSRLRLLCLDAGNTMIFLDHARIAAWLERLGWKTTREALIEGEGTAKRLQELSALPDLIWTGRDRPGARGWGAMIGTMIREAGVSEARLPELLPALWVEHEKKNLYSLVPPGIEGALDCVRALGVKVAVVSNSEGMLETLFRDLGLLSHVDLVADSARLGVEKPDPRIFRHVMDAFRARPEEALHLGDSIATDVLGAKNAGVAVMLVDPYGHCAGRALDVPRVPGVVEVCQEIAASRRAQA